MPVISQTLRIFTSVIVAVMAFQHSTEFVGHKSSMNSKQLCYVFLHAVYVLCVARLFTDAATCPAPRLG